MKNVALITGASSGLGKEFARLHASKGGDLVIVARSVAKLEALAEELHDTYGTAVVVLPKDLSRPDAPQEIYDAVHDKGITIDILINNAGLGGQGAFVERSMEDDMNLLAIDVIALTKLTKLFLRDFLARDAGKILNVSSTAALMPGPLQATYYAAKAYVTSLGDALWQEAQGTHVTVTTLMPGGMDTGFAKASRLEHTSLAKQMTFPPMEIAKDGYAAMMRGDMKVISKFTTLQKIVFKLLPCLPKKMVMRQILKMQAAGSR